MEFQILGPLEIVDDGRPLTLRGTKKRALLAVLLLHANEVVSQERLIEDLWGERRPETAATAVHGYVSQLRKLLEPTRSQDHSVLVTRAPGYELRVDPETLDLKRFEQLAEEGRRVLAAGDAATAAAMLEEALSLWRGRPLAEFEASPFALVESLRLEEVRLSVVDDRVQADLALGRHAALLPELETLVAERPHDERLCGYLMLALYRSGRQAEALAAYQRTRHALVEELGIEPGSMLQQLERAILNHEPALDLSYATERLPGESAKVVAARGRRIPRLVGALALAALCALAAGLGLAFALRGGQPAPILLAPNSVGFVDAETGRVTHSFPIGREPTALAVANDSVWVASYREKTVTRIDRESGPTAPIPVGGHPIDITSFRGRVWVWTLEGLLVAIDRPDPIRVPISPTREGGIVASGDFLWLTAPPTAVIRVDPERPERRLPPIVPPFGTAGPIASGEGEVWVAGSEQVFPIPSHSDIPRTGAAVGGIVRDVAVSGGSVWVLSGGPNRVGGSPRLRRVDRRTRFPQTAIAVGQNPRVVAVTDDSVWVGGRDGGEGTVYRVDPAGDRVVDIISVGAIPSAIAADREGVWVAAT
jgi:DNA-binding SARP family transcriptional activator/DNA-binding beta-propeller fold protein YncE